MIPIKPSLLEISKSHAMLSSQLGVKSQFFRLFSFHAFLFARKFSRKRLPEPIDLKMYPTTICNEWSSSLLSISWVIPRTIFQIWALITPWLHIIAFFMDLSLSPFYPRSLARSGSRIWNSEFEFGKVPSSRLSRALFNSHFIIIQVALWFQE